MPASASVRKAGQRVRITAQLIDAATGHHVWAERYDRELATLGVTDTQRLTAAESQSLYENLIKNLKRLALLVDWWEVGRVEGP